MTPREFLQANIDVINPALMKRAAADLDKLSNDAWTKKYFKDFSGNKDTALDFRNLINYKSLPERLRGSFGDMGFNPNETWKQAIYQTEYSDVPREEFEKQLSKMKDYYDYETKLQENNKARNERIKEVKDLPLYKDVLTSDYSKQRYINDPTTSVLGGKQFNPYSSEGQRELRDVILGATAGVADVVPTPLQTQVWLGPALRTGRDVIHGETDEAYKPEARSVIDYGKQFVQDAAANAIFEYTPNFLARKLGRVEQGAGKQLNKYISQPYEAMKLRQEGTLINKSYNEVNRLLNSNLTPLEMYNQIKALPDSEYKNTLLKNINLESGSIPSQIEQQQRIWSQQLNPQAQRAFADARNAGLNVRAVGTTATQPSDYFLRASTQPDLNKVQRLESKLMGIGSKAVIPASKPFIRPTEVIEYEDPDFERKKEAMKVQFGESWLKYGKAFAPKAVEGDPAWEAYKEVMGIE